MDLQPGRHGSLDLGFFSWGRVCGSQESSAQIKKMPFKSTSSHWNTGIRKSHIWKAVQRELLSGVEMGERESKGDIRCGALKAE